MPLLPLLLALQAYGQALQPQPRAAYDMHAARINQIRATSDFRQLVTVGQDKTIRVWRVADLRLQRTLHVPGEPGEEGALRALAVTPDGRFVIAGGWTGISWTGASQLYKFELASGRMVGRIGRFPDVVESLALSPDGRLLAVGLGRQAGLRVLDLLSGQELLADTDYNERVMFIDFAINGTLATTSADGCLRLYDAQMRLFFRASPSPDPAGKPCAAGPLGGVRFSPDGRLLAFGFQERAEMILFDPARRRVARVVHVDEAQQRSLCCLNWSLDGSQVYFHGAFDGDGPTPLYRLTLASGALERMPVGRLHFTNVLPLPDGGVVFSTSAPSLARVSPDGRVMAEALPPNGDFRFEWNRLLLSADGTRLALPMDAPGQDLRYFAFGDDPQAAFRRPAPRDLAGLSPPARTGATVDAVLGDFGYKHPVRVNGQPLALKPFQSVRSWATGAGRVALGTQWSVMATDLRGQRLWEQDLPAPAYQVSVSGNGEWVVAAVGDGTVRWYAAASGREALGAFLHANGADWVAWRPDGYYASSPAGDQYLGWLINRGDDREPDFVRAVQLERNLYRPERLRLALQGSPVQPRSGSADRPLSDVLTALSAPRVRIEAISEATREVRFSVESTGAPVREVGVYAEGIPVLTAAQRQVSSTEPRFTRTVVIPPGMPLDRVRVEAESPAALGLDETAVLRSSQAAGPGRRLWVVAIGVAKFDGLAACSSTQSCSVAISDLPNASNDASVLTQLLRKQYAGAFEDFHATMLTHSSGKIPTKAAILSALQELEAAQPQDTVLVFLASHGFAGGRSSPEYYFLPTDVQPEALEQIVSQAQGMKNAPANPIVPSLLSGTELNDALRRVAGRRIVIIDTCHAGAAGVSTNPYLVAKRSAAAQYAVLSASTGDEVSFEHIDRNVRHGIFTYALIQALQGSADGDADGFLTLEEAFHFVTPQVKHNAELITAAQRTVGGRRKEFTQTPVLYAGDALRHARLGRIDKESPPSR